MRMPVNNISVMATRVQALRKLQWALTTHSEHAHGCRIMTGRASTEVVG